MSRRQQKYPYRTGDDSGGLPRMTRSFKIVFVCIAAFSALVVAYALALSHGYLDRGQFRILESWRSTTGQVAMLAERLDPNEFLSGPEYYVLIGDHVYSPSELRRGYYSDSVIFDTGKDCLRLRWDGTNSLVVKCQGSFVAAYQIDYQQRHIGNMSIKYENIAIR